MTRSKRVVKIGSSSVQMRTPIIYGPSTSLNPGEVVVLTGKSKKKNNTRSQRVNLASSRVKSKKRVRKSRSQALLARDYIDSVVDPLNSVPPSIGAGSVMPFDKKKIWARKMIGVDALSVNNFLIVWSLPSISAIINYSFITSSFVAPVYTSLQSSNYTTFVNAVTSARTISGGFRVQAMNSLANVPVSTWTGSVFDTPSFFGTLNVDQLVNLASTKVAMSPSTLSGGYAFFRPADIIAFTMSGHCFDQPTSTTRTNIQYTIIQFEANKALNFMIDTVYHLETNSGVIGGTAETDDVTDESPPDDILDLSPEQTARLLSDIPHIPSSGGLSDLLSSVIDQEVHRQSERLSGISLRSEGGLVGALAKPTLKSSRFPDNPCQNCCSSTPPAKSDGFVVIQQ